MKRTLTIACMALAAALYSTGADAQQTPNRNDSIAAAAKINALKAQRDDLQKTIKAEDAKRNRQIAGVAPESMEAINDRQDSLCLALRSQLVDVLLQIKELSPNMVSPALIQQYNRLVKPKKEEQPQNATDTTQPAKQSEGNTTKD